MNFAEKLTEIVARKENALVNPKRRDLIKAAALIVERKNNAIQSAIDDKVRYLASGNPGCAGHLESHRPDSWGSVEIVHPIELVARALSTSNPRSGETGRK